MTNKDTAMLIVFEGKSPKQQWVLQDSIIIIGRGEDCQIIIEDRQASRHHARITQSAQGYILEDLDSKNGTYLNGQPLTTTKVLEDGDEIGIAFAAKLSFVDSGATVPLVFEARTEPTIQVDQAAKRVWVRGVELDPPLSLSQYRLLELL